MRGIRQVALDRWLAFKHRRISEVFQIPSHLSVEERIRLYELSRNAAWVAEIGSYLGASAVCFCRALRDTSGGKLICIDTWNNEGMSEGIRDTWEEFNENTSSYSQSIIPIRGFSSEVTDKVRAVTDHLDLLFIDGDHSYDAVKSDWERYRGFLRQGSIIVFHDYGWVEGIQRVVHENAMPAVAEFEAMPNMWWGRIAAPGSSAHQEPM